MTVSLLPLKGANDFGAITADVRTPLMHAKKKGQRPLTDGSGDWHCVRETRRNRGGRGMVPYLIHETIIKKGTEGN